MYLHDDFIKMIKSRFAYAHKGNVNQLLESFDKLARDDVHFWIECNHVDNCEQLTCWYGDKNMVHKLPFVWTDNSCFKLIKFLSTVRDKMSVLVS